MDLDGEDPGWDVVMPVYEDEPEERLNKRHMMLWITKALPPSETPKATDVYRLT
jgi:hypothetical protein